MHIGRFCVVLATLLLLPSVTHAANADPALRRSDTVDVRRLGKVSEDERSVLRMEWRAGLAGAEETRTVQDMLDNLQRLEAGISEVSLLIRDMPVQKPGAAAPVAAEVPDASEFDWRLPVANIAALVLVALWWFRRRKPGTHRPETGPASASEVTAAERDFTRSAFSSSEHCRFRHPSDSAPGIPSVATQLSTAVTPATAQPAKTRRTTSPSRPTKRPMKLRK